MKGSIRQRSLGPWEISLDLSLDSLSSRTALLLLTLAAALVFLAACGGNDEEKRATETATAAAIESGATALPLNTPAPTTNETGLGGIETAARKLLADELEVDGRSFRLNSSERMMWSDASLGCPEEGMAYAQVITPGYKLVFDLAGTSYAVHTNSDGSHMVICGDGR